MDFKTENQMYSDGVAGRPSTKKANECEARLAALRKAAGLSPSAYEYRTPVIVSYLRRG